MKAITLWQPWASLVAIGIKTIETRSWGVPHRGPLAIHAAKRWDEEIAEACRQAMEELKKHGELLLRPECKLSGLLKFGGTLGCIVAVTLLVDCRQMRKAPDAIEAAFGNFGPGRWGWMLDGVEPVLPPVPCRGMQGLWDVPEEIAARLPAPSGHRIHQARDLFPEER